MKTVAEIDNMIAKRIERYKAIIPVLRECSEDAWNEFDESDFKDIRLEKKWIESTNKLMEHHKVLVELTEIYSEIYN